LNIILLILLAGFTKRAQIPFSAWLPAAISAPTPVSALVHSSTLVTAGIYLIMRNIFIIRTRILRVVFLFIRILTMIISGLIACMEKDMKKVVAISTLRQLGIIMFVLFRFEISNRFIHIVCHALFKALLFLCCGIFIILRFGSQDSRFIRGYGVLISTTRVMLIRSSLRLMGFPFSSGFYSKDLLIEIRINSMTVLLSFFIALGCIITFFYSLRLLLVGLKTRKLGNFILFLKEPYKELLAMILMFLWICLSGLIIRFILELNSW
jgi:NADH-ubiquinone oxidoreductase chain 5